MFYNTIKSTGQMLLTFESQAQKQNDIILKVFESFKYKALTPFEVQKLLLSTGKDYPITSIRRAITDLTSEGKLQKLQFMKCGNYGKPNHCWQYV